MGFGFLKGVIAILKGKQTPNALAAGFALGAIFGLMPKGNLFALFFFLMFFLTTADKPVSFLSAAIFTPIGPLFDSLAHKIGLKLLAQTPALTPLWTKLYNMAFIPWTKFNNTVVLGQLVIGLVRFIPLFFAMKRFVAYYQKNLSAAVNRLKVVQMIKALRVYTFWESV